MQAVNSVEAQAQKIQQLEAENNTLQKRCEQYAHAYDTLQHQLKELLRHRFGKKSERFVEDAESPQLSIFEETMPMSLAEETQENGIKIAAHVRKKKTAKEKNLPVRIEIVPLAEADKQCPCGACKTVIRYETKQLLHHVPTVVEIVEQRREVAACPKGCDGQIVTAPAPLQILPKAKATEEFLSFLIVSKLEDRQPLYHLEKQLNTRYGIDCSRQTMARWSIELMAPLQPIYNVCFRQLCVVG